jgi:hypothetical protein
VVGAHPGGIMVLIGHSHQPRPASGVLPRPAKEIRLTLPLQPVSRKPTVWRMRTGIGGVNMSMQ